MLERDYLFIIIRLFTTHFSFYRCVALANRRFEARTHEIGMCFVSWIGICFHNANDVQINCKYNV